MDLDQFTSPNFNPVTYLNQQLPPANPDTYYTSASSLLPNLELLARNAHADLNDALSTLLRTSTRLGIDMDTLTHNTRTLAAQIPHIENDVASLKLESGVMSELSLLEVVQERMQQTLELFVRAGQWTAQTDEEIRFLIDSRSYDMAEQRISELRDLLGIWDGTVEFKERAERVQALEKALTAARAPVPTTVPSTTANIGTSASRAAPRAPSRLRVDSSEGFLRETSSGIFGQLRQNIGR